MGFSLIKKEEAARYDWGVNCKAWVLTDTPGLSVKFERIPPGAGETLHMHRNALQFFYVLKGTAAFEVEDQTIAVSENQGIRIYPGTPHAVLNRGPADLELLVVSQPDIQADRVNLDRTADPSP